MGLFGKKTDSGGGILSWLNEVDKCYSLAFQTKNIGQLQNYVSRDCAVDLIDKIRAGEKAYAGLDRYKHVQWFKKSADGDTVTFIKDVHYDHVKFSQGVVAPVGDDHKEKWVVQINPSMCVNEIRRVYT